MNGSLRSNALIILSSVALGACATCGPGTIETDGSGWRFERDDGFVGFFQNNFNKVCLPVGTVSDCTDFQMVEEDGGGWRSDRDGGGWRVDRDGGGWRYDRDGGGWQRERDEPHHPGDAGQDLEKIFYVPTGVCRVGVPPP
jgi:hypothetical protein